MKKSEVISIYSFLGNNIKMSALSKEEVRNAIIKLIRELKKSADEIFNELKVVNEPAFDGNKEEVQNKILEEDYPNNFTKVDEDVLLTAIAESKVEIPVLAVLNSFKEIIKN